MDGALGASGVRAEPEVGTSWPVRGVIPMALALPSCSAHMGDTRLILTPHPLSLGLLAALPPWAAQGRCTWARRRRVVLQRRHRGLGGPHSHLPGCPRSLVQPSNRLWVLKPYETVKGTRVCGQDATGRKAVAPTQFNPNSTRGHCILMLELERPHPQALCSQPPAPQPHWLCAFSSRDSGADTISSMPMGSQER